MHKTKKVLSIVLTLISVLTLFTPVAEALYYNGTSWSSGGHGVTLTNASYWAMDYPYIGYRFSLVDESGSRIGSIKDIKRTGWGHTDSSMMKTKRNKVELIAKYKANTLDFETTDTLTYGNESAYQFQSALPTPDKMPDWIKKDKNIDPILNAIQSKLTAATMPYGYRLIIEPLIEVGIAGERMWVTPTEIATFGVLALGASSTGGDADWGTSFGTIKEYTNRVYPNSLATNDSGGLFNLGWTAASKITGLASFATIITKGYGVYIAYNKTAVKPNSISIKAFQTNEENARTPYPYEINVSLRTSATATTDAVTLSYNYDKGAFYKEGIPAGTYYIFSSISDEEPNKKAYSGKYFTIKASADNKTAEIDYYYTAFTANQDFLSSITMRYYNGSTSVSITKGDWYLYLLNGTKYDLTATLKPATSTLQYHFSGFTHTNLKNNSSQSHSASPWKYATSGDGTRLIASYPARIITSGSSELLQWNATFKTNGGKWHDTGNTNDEVIAYKVNDSVVPGTDRGYLVKDYNHFKSWKVTAADNTSWGTVNSAQYWNTSDPTNSKFTVKKSTDKYTGNVTLTAQWELNKLHVSYWTESSGTTVGSGYKLSGGEIHTSSGSRYYDTTPYDTSLTLKTAANFGLSRTGYSFGGWKMYYWDSVDRAGYSINSTIYTSLKPSTVTTALKNYKTNHYNKLHGNIDIKTGEVYVYMVAVWNPNAYTVHYDGNKPYFAESVKNVPSNQTKYYNVNLTLSSTKPTADGYTFTGWNTAKDGSGTSYKSGATYSGNSSLTLYAQWTPNKLHITYWSDKNSYCNKTGFERKDDGIYKNGVKFEHTGTYNIAVGTVVSSDLGLEYTGHTFKGWSLYYYNNGTGDKITDTPNTSFTPKEISTLLKNYYKNKTHTGNIDIATGDVYIYFVAKWDLFPYAVTYVKNTTDTVNNMPDKQTKYYNVDLTLSSKVPTRAGYTFQNWNTKSDGSGTTYTVSGVYKTNANVTLYAQWKINTYPVTYNKNTTDTVNSMPASQTKTYNVDLTLSSTKPTRTGYTFKDWNTKADGKGTTYTSGSVYKTNAALTLYAQWTPNIYTITCDKQSGTGGTSTFYEKYATGYYSDAAATTKITKITVPTRTGYTFGGYYTKTGGNGTLVVDASGNIKTANTFFTANTTIYAKWTPKIFTITCDRQGGTGGTATFYEKYANGYYSNAAATTAITKITVPTRANYTFKGYYTQTGGKGTLVIDTAGNIKTGNTFFTANTTIYAYWVANVYKITCDKQGGTGGTDLFYEKYATGYYSDADATKAITKITVPTKNGYAFGGYYTQTGGKGTLVVDASGNIKTANTFFTANTTIYAKWTPYTVKVTYRTANANASVSSSYKLTPLSSGSSVSRIFTSKDELVTTSSSYNNSFKLTAPGTFGLKRTKLHFVGWTLCFTTSSGSVTVQNDGKDVVLDPIYDIWNGTISQSKY